MATDAFECLLTLRSIWHVRPPEVLVTLDDCCRWQGLLETELELDWSRPMARGQHCLAVTFSGKTNADTTAQHDQAVVIEQVEFFGIRDDRFRWQGVYQPEYPEPWCTEQSALGLALPKTLCPHTYLGWNGVWRLEFTSPIFTWMHGVLDLGWIYP